MKEYFKSYGKKREILIKMLKDYETISVQDISEYMNYNYEIGREIMSRLLVHGVYKKYKRGIYKKVQPDFHEFMKYLES